MRNPRVMGLPAIPLLMIAVSIGAAFGLVILTQNTPPLTGNQAILTGCTSLTTSSQFVQNIAGTARFRCGISPSLSPALTSIGGTVTPTFNTLPPGATQLSLTAHDPNTSECSIGPTVLSSTSGLTVPAGNYDYCLAYSGSASINSFQIQWSQ